MRYSASRATMAGEDKMSEEQVAELRQAFNEFDVDGIKLLTENGAF